MCSQADTGKLGALGWQARVSLEQGLKLILQKEAAD